MTVRATVAEYAEQLKALLPSGPAWTRERDGVTTGVLDATAEEFTRVHNRNLDLLDEVNPLTTIEMLADWERVAGLPDSCTCDFVTIEQRRRALLTKLASTGGQSPQYYVELAAVFGWEIEVHEYRPFRAGMSAAGDPLSNSDGDGDGWAHVWRVVADSPVFYFTAGQGAAGEPLATWGNSPLECLLNRWKPAHTLIIFDYT